MPDRAKLPRISVFSSNQCPHCRAAKAFLKKHGIRYEDLNVERSAAALKQFNRLKLRGVPVILIGRIKINGYNPQVLQQKLLQAGYSLKQAK